MKSFALCLLVLLPLVYATNKCSEAQKERRNKCGGLVTEPSSPPSTAAPSAAPTTGTPSSVPTPPPGMCYCTPLPTGQSPSGAPGSGEGDFHSRCPFIESCWNMSAHLSVSEAAMWSEWIVMVEETILANLSLSNDDKVVRLSVSLKAFFQENLAIYYKLQYKPCGGAAWGGHFEDFIHVHIDILAETSMSVITLDSTGNCPLFDAVREACQDSDCDTLIVEMELMVKKGGLDKYQQMGQISEMFEAFFSLHVSLKASFEVDIKGHGPLLGFLSVCRTYKRTTTITSVISGSSVSDCPVLQALENAKQNQTFGSANITQIQQLQSKITAYFAVEVDVSLRMNFVAEACFEQMQLSSWMVSIIMDIRIVDKDGKEWGNFYEIGHSSGICFNCGCGNPNNGASPSGTTVGPTTAAPSTAAPVTTPAPADCSKCGSLITIDANYATSLVTSLNLAYNTSFTPAQKLGANSCFNSVKRAVYNSTATMPQKLSACRLAFAQYNANNVTAQQLVFNITITDSVTQTVWGQVKQFVGCIAA